MKACIGGVTISSVCAVVPSRVSKFEDEIKEYPFSERSSRKLAKTMGFKEHRIAPANVTLIDLAEYGVRSLFDNHIVSKNDVGALIFVSQQHEYPVPGNSKVLHNRLGLNPSTHCIDMYENCSGFISGLFSASSILASTDISTVILVNSSAGTIHLNIKDRNTYPIMGDGAGITVIQKTTKEEKIYFDIIHDSSELNTLIVPAGGMRTPSSEDTRKPRSDSLGNLVKDEDLHMDGAKVFHFVMETIPRLTDEICKYSGVEKGSVDYFITHQPNKFLVDKLTELLGVDQRLVFDNIVENFGNSSSATIPVNLCFNLSDKLKNDKLKICFSAFGAGMSAGCAICDIGKLNYCDLLEYPCD